MFSGSRDKQGVQANVRNRSRGEAAPVISLFLGSLFNCGHAKHILERGGFNRVTSIIMV